MMFGEMSEDAGEIVSVDDVYDDHLIETRDSATLITTGEQQCLVARRE